MSEPVAKRSRSERVKGIATIKPQYVLETSSVREPELVISDDAAEGAGLSRANDGTVPGTNKKNNKKNRGQNKGRKLVQAKDIVKFCEREKDATGKCTFGDGCRFEHDVEVYLESKPADISGACPVYSVLGYCPAGIKCRWLGSHYENLVVLIDEAKKDESLKSNYEVNRVSTETQHLLQRKKFDLSLSEKYINWMHDQQNSENGRNEADKGGSTGTAGEQEPAAEEGVDKESAEKKAHAAAYVPGVVKATEKKRLNYAGAKILSPLTTVGNLPYRRLMKTLGVDVTFSEMALSLPLIQGSKSEWALARAHSSELDRFGVQIASSKPWQAIKAAQVLSELTTKTAELNINCGCPIDLLYRQGAGSALLDSPAKILRMARGMNAVSGDIPVTVKIRTGTRDGHPTAKNLVRRLVDEQQVASITLHGRSRAQRYTKEADWQYIKEVVDVIKEERADKELKPWIVGNGDIYSHEDWYEHIEQQGVDTCMVARGALIKPWIFEEIDARQYLDVSAQERLDYLRKYAEFGLEHWGSDEYGVNQTRRYLCEWMSFTHRYIPVGILEYLPPRLNDRPPPWQGRNELETLLASGNYKDWIKVSEMFLGPAPDTFEFTPKHKSNSYN